MSILRIALLQISPCGGAEANLAKELEGSRDTCILQADGGEGIFVAELDIDMLRRYRESEVHGNAYRRPKKYSLLTSTEISPPFVRDDHRE